MEMEDVMSADAIVTDGESAPLSAAKIVAVILSSTLRPSSSMTTFDAE